MIGRIATVAALALAAAAGVPAMASAAITDSRADPLALAKTIANEPARVTDASFTAIAPANGVPAAISDTALTTFPRNGTAYAILSTGNATIADDENTSGSSGSNLGYTAPIDAPNDKPNRGPEANDPVTLRMSVDVPAGMNCLIVRFRFFSEEFPEFVNSAYNDAFIAELDTTTWSTTAASAIVAPDNFAFDESGNAIAVNDTGVSNVTAANATGTTFDAATRRLAAAKLVTPGAHKLFLSIVDAGDFVWDSAVFLDGLEFRAVEASKCVSGAFQDDVPPALTSGNPTAPPESLVANGQYTKDDTPTFGGKAGIGLNDDPNVVGNIFAAGPRATPVSGTPLQTKSVPVAADGSWIYTADTLPEGNYTFQASQGASNGETAYNDPITFSVDKSAPGLTNATTLYSGKTRDTTPLLGGAAGAAASDSGTVTFGLFAGRAATGAPLASAGVLRTAAAWSFQTAQPLKDGVYTALASQADAAGNAANVPLTFAVTTSNPIGKVKFPKRVRRASASRKVAGSLLFAFPGRVTFRLTATIGKRTYVVGKTVVRTLKAPGLAKFSFTPNRGLARRIRRGRGVFALRTTFVDDQKRTYRKTQKVAFR